MWKIKAIIALILVGVVLWVILSSVSDNAEKLIQDPEFKKQIHDRIVSDGKKKYGLELDPDIEGMKYRNEWLPFLPSEDRIRVSVKTKQKPVYEFEATVHIDDTSEDRKVTSIDILGRETYGGLVEIGDFLLTHQFKEKHKDVIREINAFSKNIQIDRITVLSALSEDTDSEKEAESMLRALAKDYTAGKFTNTKSYDDLMHQYRSDDLPVIEISYFKLFGSESSNNKHRDAFIAYFEKKKNLPPGEYHIDRPATRNNRSPGHDTITVDDN